ncbi:TetR family transcriptional regulator [Luteimicrobium album]|uniref:TetR family transcriptional regulator n=1 Tax=Luteimicrobium album TaxID=1054550 RepID=A0ABQ6I8Y8_9MICO|nr:TetR/AcrR family transcriptional regulator C-terminal domain-containing protein [Luteimicrobium album]GMA26474.1 TetR family transcriptional regulator [Luteimicrobium album]
MSKGLTRDQVVRAALALLDEVGLDDLTMRALAARLDVKAAALYWHVRSKADLVDEMGTALWRETLAALPARCPADRPDELLVAFARTLRATLLSHRDGARLFAGTYLTDVTVLEAQEPLLASLVGHGLDLDTAIEVSTVLYAFTVGATVEEQSVRQVRASGDARYDLTERERRLDHERFPLVTAAGRLSFPDPAARFDRAVRRLVASFEGWASRA